MKKVSIEFPSEFETDEILPLPIGRLMIGGRVCRLVFTPAGELHLYAPKSLLGASVHL